MPWLGGGDVREDDRARGRAISETMAIDPGRYRQVFAHMPTGVTVITAHGADEALGMAANSVTSASLDAALVLFCPARSSTTWRSIRAAGAFCINVMASHHGEVTRRFASKEGDRF